MGPSTKWIRALDALSAWAVREGFALVSGEGLLWMDFGAWVYRRHGGGVEIVSASGKKTSWARRDDEVAEKADVLVAVAIRSGGAMHARAMKHAAEKRVHYLEETVSAKVAKQLNEAGADALEIALPQGSELPSELPPARFDPAIPCLWHFTRRRTGPWPGESSDEYFTALVENHPGAAHSASDALGRILLERRIRACSALIRGGEPVVCLSELAPPELLKLRRFRPALCRWDFEPAAVGIPLEFAQKLSLSPVKYLSPDDYETLSSEERFLYQKHSPPRVDFTHEKEWRSRGDIDLSAVPFERLQIYYEQSLGTG